MRIINRVSLLALIAILTVASLAQSNAPGVVKSEFIYETAPFPECHASTIAETKTGLVAAWFGGTEEKHPDVGIWVSRLENSKWTTPVEVANGVESASKRYPTWNPVLHQAKNGSLLLFYKVGPDPQKWWGMLTTSGDGGKTWSKPERLPDNIAGPIKNKPVELSNGDLLCPSSSEDNGWRVHFERTRDNGKTWSRTEPINDGKEFGVIQPTVF
ncbi:MAG: sialidase family protein, partial [Acidobacteriota bacterium]